MTSVYDESIWEPFACLRALQISLFDGCLAVGVEIGENVFGRLSLVKDMRRLMPESVELSFPWMVINRWRKVCYNLKYLTT